MQRTNKIFALLLIAVMLLTFVLSGCESNNITNETTVTQDVTTVQAQNSTETTTAAKWNTSEKRTIVFSTINNYYTTALKQIAKDYTVLHPETTVEIEIIADNEAYKQNFNTKMAADKKTAPDIVHVNLLGANDAAIGEFMSKGWIVPMDSILDEENPYNGNAKVKDVFDESWLKFAVCSTGQVSYLPFDLVGVGFYYNKDVFSKLGLNTPSTYEELVEVCKKLKENGYEAPIGATVFADFMMASLADWNLRQYTDQIISMPGDARYDEKTMIANAEMKYDANNPSFDSLVTEDPEKMLAFTKTFDRKSAVSQRIWETYKGVAQYFQKGFTASTDADVYSQFMAQKYPIYVMGSWQVGTILGDMKKLSDDKKFNWGTFKFPSLAEPGGDFQGQPRGILIPGHRIGLAQKDDPEQTNRAADFLKYMYSPEVASKIYDITIKNGEFVQGPPLVKGVTLSDEVASYLDGFKVDGNMRQDWMNVIGAIYNYFLSNEQPLYNDAKQKYVEGKINWDEFSTTLDKLLQNKVADEVKKNNYDLDSKTNDKK